MQHSTRRQWAQALVRLNLQGSLKMVHLVHSSDAIMSVAFAAIIVMQVQKGPSARQLSKEEIRSVTCPWWRASNGFNGLYACLLHAEMSKSSYSLCTRLHKSRNSLHMHHPGHSAKVLGSAT